MTKIFIGAGEASSDRIAGWIVKEMPDNVKIIGITGDEMKKNGVETLFNTTDIAFIGLDIIWNIRKITHRINLAADWIIKNNPEVALFVDAYDFYIRVAKKVKESNCKTKIIAVVAPAAWLYSQNKVKSIARYFDQMICIFPFEVDFFKKHGYDRSLFFGNPFLQKIEKKDMVREKKLALITIGSRPKEVSRHIPLIKHTISIINNKYPDVKFAIPTTKETYGAIYKIFNNQKNITVFHDEEQKDIAMRTAWLAIAKSGTNTSEIIARNLPCIVYYKIGLLSYLIGKFVLKIKSINMINIISGKMIVPEIVQVISNPKKIANAFFSLYEDQSKRDKQIIECTREITKMSGDGVSNFEKNVAKLTLNIDKN